MPLLPRQALRPRRADTAPAAEALEPRRLLAASPVVLVKDLDPRTYGSMTDTGNEMVTAGALAYFTPTTTSAADGGRELWRTDGTEAGTRMVKDIVPGDAGSSPRNLTVAGGTVYFLAAAPGSGLVLWKSDGTEAGTVAVLDAAGHTVPSFRILAAIDDWRVILLGGDPLAPQSLWVSDGTPAGTAQVAPPLPDASFNLGNYAAAGGQLFFLNAGDLWRTDGTAAGTRLVKDILPGPGVPQIYDMTPAGNLLYFAAIDGTTGYDLWRSDGTAAGTFKVKDLPGNSPDSFNGPGPMVWTGDTLYFTHRPALDELWKSDGTAAGTVKVKDLVFRGSSPLGAAGGKVYFVDFVAGKGWKLWTSDGTAAGSHVIDNAAGDLTVVDGTSFAMHAVGGRLFFNGVTPATGEELWVTDGTAAGTRLTRDALPGPASSFPQFERAASGRLYFATDDGMVGREPWVSDGTEAGTQLIRDFNRQPLSSEPFGLAPGGDRRAYFFDFNTATPGLWTTDGSATGTTFVAPLKSGLQSGNQLPTGGAGDLSTSLGDAFIFSGNPLEGAGLPRLYTSDGTAAGTAPIGSGFTSPYRLTAVGDRVFFAAFSTEAQPKLGLYVTDGTDAGTRGVAGQPALQLFDDARPFVDVGGVAYFRAASSEPNSYGLWRSDGTPEGTRRLEYRAPAVGNDDIGAVANLGGALVFTAWENGRVILYRSDGTAAGTVAIKTLAENEFGINAYVPSVVGGLMYFNGPGGLWRTDGTAGGTFLLKEGVVFNNQGNANRPSGALAGRFYFSMLQSNGDGEIWSTDGTVAGTSRVAQFGKYPSLSEFTTVGDVMYFSAFVLGADGYTHPNLWRTDGTTAGTYQAWDVPGDSDPRGLVALNADLLFVGTDRSSAGRELWKVPAVPQPPFVVGRHVFYNNSRFDGRDPAANRADDGAIAADKQALGFGEIGSFRNVTSYAKGINGVMVDLTTRFDFFDEVHLRFSVGTGGDPSAWGPAPTPLTVVHRNDGVPEDVDRVSVTWPDGAIRNTWLQVTAEALFGGRVVATDVFYFGNLVGETGATPALRVDAADFAATRGHLRESASLDNAFDFNRDGRIDTLDLNLVRGNLFKSLGAIAGPPPPAAGSVASPGAATRSAVPKRRSLFGEIAGSPNSALP